MTSASPRSRALTALVVAAASGLALAACSSSGPPPAPLPPAPIPVNAPAPPPVALSTGVLERAAQFRSYMNRASMITPRFTNGPAIEESLAMGEGYESQQLAEGAIAYAAVVALQEPGFVAGVRTYAVDPAQRKELAQKILSDPRYATVLPGAAAAAGMIIASLNDSAGRLRGAGELVKQAAYDVQHQAWSKGFVTDPAGRLARAKTVSGTTMSATSNEVELMKDAIVGSKSADRTIAVAAPASAPPFTPVVTRGLALAALAALGEAGDENDAQVQTLLNETSGGFCLHMSKLNLYQCLAVAKPWYEDMFCLGQHVLIDTGQCIAKAAGQPQPVQPPGQGLGQAPGQPPSQPPGQTRAPAVTASAAAPSTGD